ncbi:bacteriophage holin [Haloarcula onubensis]|uniref:Bacteriophage holin n=1 Tax=Haloarcula onubensis TaxID=2950539 RepID=A0ABU2FPL9_9EURY|nr:bacteriophage holin [Halomicroarcula sp. S3CR25-11]MDS0282703.1 bacteriophage holin [Halomicroarcula sp. S3CR25-11]
MDTETAPLDVRAFGLACGVLWAGAVVVLGLTARIGWGRRWERLLADVYRGYDETASGLVVGAGWAFLDGCGGGVAFAWLYNALAGRGR